MTQWSEDFAQLVVIYVHIRLTLNNSITICLYKWSDIQIKSTGSDFVPLKLKFIHTKNSKEKHKILMKHSGYL